MTRLRLFERLPRKRFQMLPLGARCSEAKEAYRRQSDSLNALIAL